MSTHNIGFYEDLTKIIFELSSNIVKNLISAAESPLILYYKTLASLCCIAESFLVKGFPDRFPMNKVHHNLIITRLLGSKT